ncbi:MULTISPECIES: hypothetical protein [unclassified Rhizobium]|jgi:hypothetical protein|uniref:hypothetical protein n=1 Tax=unclassified Rhizobium TaxID=2613769 RepID=UPI0006462A1F|nr:MULTISPECIES: hypothetical protein [unclassified Rhizobium]MBN8949127.1 hypothetical protein [Rhizobium tropici]OJY74723.1 MAG: hypothetical protein BGP09_33355 [Rhizobium sp. 60-20]RKD66767.1 hypothetical protein BJ928_106295 [Rhizobium sp. WW_1]
MSTYLNSLKKQNEFLQGEVERFANAVDRLADQLSEAQSQLQAQSEPVEVDPSPTNTVRGPERGEGDFDRSIDETNQVPNDL